MCFLNLVETCKRISRPGSCLQALSIGYHGRLQSAKCKVPRTHIALSYFIIVVLDLDYTLTW